MTVLKGFIAQANESYRNAGLSEYQMKLDKHGNITIPTVRARAKAAPAAGAAAPEQAATGAATTGTAAPTAGAAPAAAQRAGAAPAIAGLKPTADGFELSWKAVTGAKQYGIYRDGVLLGHVPSPKFAATLAAGRDGVIQIDAQLANGARTELTNPVRIGRDANGKLAVSDPTKEAAAATAAPAPAAPAATAAAAPAG